MTTRHFDIAVIGGGLGGVQAARAACSQGMRVFLSEETDWLGGQLTSQAVPPDEHPWIEQQGATESYLAFRRKVRDAYRADPAASPAMREKDLFCPGNSWVSRIAMDPRLAERLLRESLIPYVRQGLLEICLKSRCVEAEVHGDVVASVVMEDHLGWRERVTAAYFLDATDKGDLLPLTGAEYRVGAEARDDTGEPHAPLVADPADQQPVTWVAALRLEAERSPMAKPDGYDGFARAKVRDVPLLGWNAWGATGLARFAMFDGESPEKPLGLWSYRRIQYPPYYLDQRPEITLLNWPQNDYVFGNIIDDPEAEKHLERARQLTLCCAYWLWEQGYPVQLEGTVLGTADGLAKAPYIRESRRIVARKTILEQEIAKAWNPTPRVLADSVGVGHYAIDLHLTTKTHTTMYEATQPFEIPLNALLPVRMRNLLPAAKNIGATHLTGGCFRLHPVEWTVGEAAGHLAAFCVRHRLEPVAVADGRLREFQNTLVQNGFQLHWSEPLQSLE